MQRRINAQGDIILLRLRLDARPASLLRQIENIVLGVELDHLQVVAHALVREPLALGLELVADEFQEDQTENPMLLLRRFHRAAQLVGSVPKILLKGLLLLC